jgi:hypothetical protein
VRAWVGERLREMPAPFVIDGRDMGSVVFPHARHKFYLDASPEVRAARRVGERSADLGAVAAAIRLRDALDARQLAPAPDAVHLDTGPLTLDEVVAWVLSRVRRGADVTPRPPGMPWVDPSTALQRVVVTSTVYKPEAHAVARTIAAAFARHVPRVDLDLEGVRPIAEDDAPRRPRRRGRRRRDAAGDRAAARGRPGPVLGVNLGKLGFLAAFGADEVLAYAEGRGPAPGARSPRRCCRSPPAASPLGSR